MNKVEIGKEYVVTKGYAFGITNYEHIKIVFITENTIKYIIIHFDNSHSIVNSSVIQSIDQFYDKYSLFEEI